ncbi:alkaline phosphatase PhoX [Mesonia aquimarina]|uniref:alkaline phosphatase PhoX n=1 Tax=Mesonia aquimarina TaxID=1504967 RepID=UPI000EF5E611|nr:alkaline phosphatase PhoX [Mesonia aquimarina]
MKKNYYSLWLVFFSIALGLNSYANDTDCAIEENCESETNCTSFAFNQQNILIATGSSWKYNDNGTDLGTSWKDVSYNDASWSTGNAIFGYGDGIESTTIDYGSDGNNKYPTYYFRKEIQVTNASSLGDLLFKVMKDDGAIVYLNGTEVARLNMPAGTVTYNTYASNAIGGSSEETFHQIPTANTLQNGTNVVAVEIHQGDAGSSDLRFDMELSFELAPLTPADFPLEKESAWNYLDDGSDLGNTNWNQSGYDYDSWSRNYGSFGYGDPVNTEISYGPDSGNKFITTYFTRDINVNLADLEDMIEFGIKRDDGAIVYVNGVEVFRDNMPSGPVDYLTTSATIISGSDETSYQIHEVPKTAFQQGVNRIAVELHNRDGQSSDLGFDMYIDNVVTSNFNCNDSHIGCFTSIVPTAQTDHLIIPQEHRFQLLFKQGEQYTDGSGTVPGNHDFTAYVPTAGSSELGHLSVNHENTPGGVSIVDLHLDTSQNLWSIDNSQPVDLYNQALVTTTRNCSGGITPWGTVVTAEESTNGGDNNNDGYEDVGWLVEIDPETAQVMDYGNGQEKLWAMGRMNHENVVISNDGTTAYYGEDGGTDCVYKYVMDTPGDLSAGTVYVLKLDLPLSGDDPTSTTAEWIEVPNDTKAERNNIRNTAAALGGTNFNGVEDCEISPVDGKIYFTAKGKGRTYRFTDAGTNVTDFETFVGGMSYTIQSTQGNYTESWGGGNDNLTFDDKGNLWVLQDGGNNYIWVVRPDHTQNNPHVELFASMPAGSEPTGLTFTPDFKYGFFSVQHPSGNNAAQLDATFNNVTLDQSATVVFSLEENLGMQAPETDFTADNVNVAIGETVTFTDLSTNDPSSWEWTFEGGTPATSTAQSPTVTYDAEGTYKVTLKTTNIAGNSTESKTQYITVSTLGVKDALAEMVSLYPNPTKDNLTIQVNATAGKEIEIEVFDLLGRTVAHISENQTTGSAQQINVNLAEFSQGEQLFIVQVKVGNQVGRYKVLKAN